MTEQRRIIVTVLSEADDHPDVEQVYKRACYLDPNISLATVYRTLRLLEEAGVLERHDFRKGKACYEETPSHHHDHLIDLKSGAVIEFYDEGLENLKKEIAQKLGYTLIDHRLELYGLPRKQS